MKTNTKEKYIEIIADKGYITCYKDSDDILHYSAFKQAICPLNSDLSIYREISEDEHSAYKAKLEEALKNDLLK